MRTIKLCGAHPHRPTTLLEAIRRSEGLLPPAPRGPRPRPTPKPSTLA